MSDKDLVEEAREMAKDYRYDIQPAARAVIRALADEVESLRRGEFICKRCYLRKDAEFERGDF